jgi:hypothetical protein
MKNRVTHWTILTTTRDYSLQATITHKLVSTLTSLMPLLSSEFQASDVGCSPSSWFPKSPYLNYRNSNLTQFISLAPLNSLIRVLASTVDSQLWAELNCSWPSLITAQQWWHRTRHSSFLYEVSRDCHLKRVEKTVSLMQNLRFLGKAFVSRVITAGV